MTRCNTFLKSSFHSENLIQMIGLQKEEHSIETIELYLTKAFSRRSQFQKIPKFVKRLFFDPMNQYILDWASYPIPKTQ